MLLFFFKQKTAYEMRISDWSSDVCSSDLLVAAPVCARYARELECGGVELARRSEVRPAAHIHPAVTAAIDGEFFALRQFGGPFGLEHLALGRPVGDQLVALPDFPRAGPVGGGDLETQRKRVV